MELNLMQVLAEKQEKNEEVALVTVISSDTLKQINLGSLMLVDRKGEVLCGNLGGGSIQEEACKEAKTCMQRGLSRKAVLSSKDGSIEVFINTFGVRDQLIIAGAGDFALNINNLARIVGYNVTIVDHRAEKLTKERFPEANELLLGDIADQLRTCNITETTSIVIATHHHEFDEPALLAVISSPAKYIGMLGNVRRVAACFQSLINQGIPEELVQKVHSPIGLDLGGEKTAEIALSVMAEIQALKYGRTGGFNKKN